jgi:threonine/homoserine/homoserine lactone efflux protein
MDVVLIGSFLSAAVILTLSPGPDILYVISSSSEKGFKTGFAIALGLCSGLLVHTSIVTFGVGKVITGTPWLFWFVKLFGAAYLLLLSWQVFRSSAALNETRITIPQGFRKLYLRGFLMNVLNPKVTLFFLAFLPGFLRPELGSVTQQSIVLSSVFIAQAILIFTLAAWFADKLLGFLRHSTSGLLFLKWAQIVLFTLIAVSILFT